MRYLLLFLTLIFLFNLKPIELSKINEVIDSEFKVEVIGHLKNPGLFTVKNFETFNDLLINLNLYEDSDISHYSLNKRLIKDDLIVVKVVEEKKKVSINGASLDEFITLKGIGPIMAQRIIDYRNLNGPYKSLEDIKNVKGIGDKVFSNIIDFITL